MKTLSLLFLSSILSIGAYGQCDDFGPRGPLGVESAGVMNGGWLDVHIPTKKVIPYEFIREADVTWSQKTWRIIDLREKFNHSLYYPLDEIELGLWNRNSTRLSLWTIMRQHIINGDLTLYSPFHPIWEQWTDGDQFKYPVVSKITGGTYCNDDDFRDEIFKYLGTEYEDPFAPAVQSLLDPTFDSTRYDPVLKMMVTVYPDPDTVWFTSKDIVQYKLKEQVFFDKERGMMETRIIGIAPIIFSKNVNGEITGYRELFWLYFPECRYVFQNYFVENGRNSSQRMSFDDLFAKRKFQSFIVKESNIYDRDIESYKSGVNALLESGKIKSELSQFEHDLWSF